MENSTIKTIEELHSHRISQVLSDAKISSFDLNRDCQILQFSQKCLPHEARLMEVTEEILALLERGEKLIFRGDRDDMAVICTDDKTFEVKEAETTNSLLLIPNCQLPEDLGRQTAEFGSNVTIKEICGIRTAYLEMKESSNVRLGKLRELLHKNLYSGTEPLESFGLSFQEILDTVQASDSEVLTELSKMFVCQIDGRYFLMDFEYLTKVMSQVINFVVNENSWAWYSFPKAEVLNTLEELEPRCILECCLNWFAQPTEEEAFWCFIESRITRLYAEILLKAAGKFHYHEFLEVWQQSVPEGMNADLKLLLSQAMVLVNEKSIPPTIQYYPVENLSTVPQERFDQLFQARNSWDYLDIEPYLRDLTSPKCDVGTLLAKYCRSSTGPAGVKTYSSKRSQ